MSEGGHHHVGDMGGPQGFSDPGSSRGCFRRLSRITSTTATAVTQAAATRAVRRRARRRMTETAGGTAA